MLKLGRKCWISAFNAQGSRGIIVAVQVGAVKIYVAAVQALKKKETQDETQFTTKIDGFLSFTPLECYSSFCRVFLNLTLCMTKLRVLVLSFPHFKYLYYKSTNLFLVCLCCWGLEVLWFWKKKFKTLKGLEVFLWFQKFPKKTPSAHISTLKNYTGNFYIILFYFDAKI
jgi:hypothetical protein